MHLTLPPNIEKLWKGRLVERASDRPPLVSRQLPGGDRKLPIPPVKASIGKPFQWSQGELFSATWKPPLGHMRFYLVQLAFTLNPAKMRMIQAADFTVRLHPQNRVEPVVYDAYPRDVLIEQTQPVTLGIGPEFKLGAVDAKLAKAEVTLDMGRMLPVVRTYGLQESTFCWRYEAHPKHPLAGSRRMFVVVALPQEMPRCLMELDLQVQMKNRYGILPTLRPPAGAADGLHWVVGEPEA